MATIGSYVRGTGFRLEIIEDDKRPTRLKTKDYDAENLNRISSMPNYEDNLRRCLHMSADAKRLRAKLAKAHTQTLTSTKPLSD